MKKQKKSNSRNKQHSRNSATTNSADDAAVVKNGGKELLPYKIQESKTLGRYLVATRNLYAGEVVMSVKPLVIGPCQEAKPLCIGCYMDIDLGNSQSYQRCKICSWPLCTSDCPGYHKPYGHSEDECSLLSKSLVVAKKVMTFKDFYYAITPLRCLVQKGTDAWEILKAMESHTEQRKKSSKLWDANEKFAVNVIRNIWGLTKFSEEEIHFVCGVLEVNAFEINLKPGIQCLRAVYSNAFLFAHDCIPNTCRSNESDFRLIFHAVRTIPANEIITVTYAYTLQCTLLRRKHLKQTKFFSCSCKRCLDPTELGTYAGAMKCLTCKLGFLLPEHPLDENSLWKCTSLKCNCEMRVTQIIPILEKFFKELDSINGNDIIGYETFLKKCGKIFHENHYLSLSAMHCLSQLYGKINGYMINDLTNEQLERKEEICRKLLKIFEKFEPGLSKQRGILLYELHASLMVLLRKKFQNITKKELKLKIKVILKYLDESYVILSKEPENSVEGQMAAAAKEAIRSLKCWLNVVN